MAIVQPTPDSTLSAQVRSMRTTSAPPSGLVYSRPWRSSPLAAHTFSTLPPIISESSEDSHEKDISPPESLRASGETRSPSSTSIVSEPHGISVSASPSAYGSRNASGVTFAGQASTSSISLPASSSAHGTGFSSQDHGNSQTHSDRPARLSNSQGRCKSPVQQDSASGNARAVSISPPPRARTISHGNSRSTSFPAQSVSPSPTFPQTYSRASPRPTLSETDVSTSKEPPSKSRDPAANWMSSTPFGPAEAPKFSRLAMASPTVVMPLSAREYRKRKAKASNDKGKEKRPASPSHVTGGARSAIQSPNNAPMVKFLPPSEEVHQSRPLPLSSDNQGPSRPQHPANNPPSPLAQASVPMHPPSTKTRRPHTPPRSSPLASHPPISPKSSAATFYSFASVSASDDDTSPSPNISPSADDPSANNSDTPVRRVPRPRRRKSVPERLSNGARLSLLEAMNRLSQESATLHRLSVASQVSGHTMFYDVDLEGTNGQAVSADEDGNEGQHTPLHTQSLEDLSSTLARTGIEAVSPDAEGGLDGPLDDERRSKRNVRMVRISDTVEISPAPVHRRRKLTKLRPGSMRGSVPMVEDGNAGPRASAETAKETKAPVQTQEWWSLLPWKSKVSGDPKEGVAGARPGVVVPVGEEACDDVLLSVSPHGVVDLREKITPAPIPHAPVPIANGPAQAGSDLTLKSSGTPAMKSSDVPASAAPIPPHKTRRSTFSFFSSPAFHRPKHEKAGTAPATFDLSLEPTTKGKPKDIKRTGSGTDSTSMSICTLTQGSQSTLTPTSYDLTSSTSEAGRAKGSPAIPMLRRLNAQATAMGMEGAPSQQSDQDGKTGSTPSLITTESTATTTSTPRTSALPPTLRLSLPDAIGEPFLPRPSGLKESYTDASEEKGGASAGERASDRRQEPSPLAHPSAGSETPEESDKMRSNSGLSLSSGQHQNLNSRSASRPGTSSSSLTTATDTSGSYVSFSTLPASTATSTTSTSRSTSPLPAVGDERDRDQACALYGRFGPQTMSPTSSPPGIHPMFTVPLVTIPAMSYSRSACADGRDPGMGVPRYANGRKSERHGSVPVIPGGVSPATWTDRHQYPYPYPQHQHHVRAPTSPQAFVATTPLTGLAPPPASKTKKIRRPQTAPAGAGDAAFRFFEDTKAMSPYENGTGNGTTRAAKHKVGESKFKMVLKGLLRRG